MTPQVILRWTRLKNSPGPKAGSLFSHLQLSGQYRGKFWRGPGWRAWQESQTSAVFLSWHREWWNPYLYFSPRVVNVCARWAMKWECDWVTSKSCLITSDWLSFQRWTRSTTVTGVTGWISLLKFILLFCCFFHLKLYHLKMNENCGKEWERFSGHSLWRQHFLLNKYTICPMLPFPRPISINHDKKMHYV